MRSKRLVVAQARNLINIITNQIAVFNDNCETEANASRKAKRTINIVDLSNGIYFMKVLEGNEVVVKE